MTAALEVSGARLPTRHDLQQVARQSLNRTIARARTFAGRKTVETYALSTREIAPYVVARNATLGFDGQLEGSVDLRIRAIPIETFKPRIVVRRFTYAMNGHVVTRRLPTVELQRFRQGAPKLVRPAFPLTQRSTGRLRSGDKVRRRIGPDRGRLTRIRYYTFPRKFVDEVLAPAVREFVGPRLQIEFDNAFRVYSLRRRRTELRRNS